MTNKMTDQYPRDYVNANGYQPELHRPLVDCDSSKVDDELRVPFPLEGAGYEKTFHVNVLTSPFPGDTVWIERGFSLMRLSLTVGHKS